MDNISKYMETLEKVATIFNNNNIRYALSGGVVAELRSGKVKEHKDIDFSVFSEQMEDIERLLMENGIHCMTDLVHLNNNDNWVDTVSHNKTANDPSTGVDIGFFTYENQDDEFSDGECVSEAGFVRKTDIEYKGKQITLRERFDDELKDYLFSEDRYENVNGTRVKVQPLPYIIMLKTRNMRGKDRGDIVRTTELLTDDEIDEYNRFKNSILSIHCTAQCGENAKEGNCDEVKRLIDIWESRGER